jgi:apolipoprotein N-acyltransferase
MRLFNKSYALALLAGAMCVFGFAPFGVYVIPVLALAVLFSLWLRAGSARTAAWQGFAFGLGLFSAGIGWIYIAMYEYGGMPLLLALLAALLFAAFWALLPALAGYIQARFPVANWLRLVVVMPAMWALLEWFRGLLVTGFPWLTLGYAHSDNPLAGYAPVLGIYGVSFAAAVSAGLLAWIYHVGAGACPEPVEAARDSLGRGPLRQAQGRRPLLQIMLIGIIWSGGALLRTIEWTQPHGEPFSVALVQGNIPQNLKFDEDALVGTLETYRRLVEQNPARLAVLPETALPLLRHQVPQSLVEKLRNHARQNGGDMLIGVFERNNGSHYNSVFTLGSADEQHYRKQHLVPFGEFIPLRPMFGWFINGVLNIPMGDLARGDQQQAPLNVAGQRVAANICFEDVFGEEIIRALPQATLLVNVTNDAWYGNSPVAAQHNQIAQFRALETGRMMLRATNTGVTSIIGADGKVLQQLPQHEEAVLNGMAQGYDGITPYVRWGNAAVLLLLIALLVYAWTRRASSPDKGRPGGVRG